MIKTEDETCKQIEEELCLGSGHRMKQSYRQYLLNSGIIAEVLAGRLKPLEAAEKVRKYARGLIEKELDHRMREPYWEYLSDNQQVNEVLAGELEPFEAADKVRYLESKFEPTKLEKQVRTPGTGTANYNALVKQLAIWAAQDPEVQEFRARMFPDGLLPPYHAGWWVEQQSKREGIPGFMLVIREPVPREVYKVRNTQGATYFDPPLSNAEWDLLYPETENLYLQYLVVVGQDISPQTRVVLKPGEFIHAGKLFCRLQICVDPKGVLDHLRKLSQKLARQYRWEEADATYFVLTGEIPPIYAITGKVEEISVNGRPVTALSRITFTIDPSFSPRKVAEEYSRLREELIGGERERDLSEKHIKLAEFATNRPENEPWAERMAAWDQEHKEDHPEWSYQGKPETNFARDCTQAQKRLFGPDYPSRKSYSQRRKKPTQRENGS